MVYFQQSLFGKTSWERFHQMTGWILEPSYPLSQTPMFQCLLLEDGQEPEWCEGERLTSLGGSWTPSIGQAPDWHDGSVSSLWQTLEDGAPTKYFLSPHNAVTSCVWRRLRAARRLRRSRLFY